ncbi:MAG: HAMP domain-containing protein [Proteobacteria bacterium]|nr:HAMP domain-containing protein [Pseudomonadota bacterium]MBU1545426.1 HAMP domain-containing protein [Pseudomonadota bacterium]MBU2620074.1 HAMP domain-containing protein [Pseudomonadota bacterium]
MEAVDGEVLRKDRLRRKKRIRLIILACLVLIPLLTYLETRVVQLGTVPFPVSGNVLIFVLINFNVLLLLLMVFLVLRNLAQLVFERRRRFLGTKLRSKLVIAFVSMSFFPTGLLFFIALQFVSTSMDYWFNSNVAQSLEESIAIAKNSYQETQEQVDRQARLIGDRLDAKRYGDISWKDAEPVLKDIMKTHGLAGIEVISGQREVLARAYRPEIIKEGVPEIPLDTIRNALADNTEQITIQPVAAGELVRGVSSIRIDGADAGQGALIVSLLIPQERVRQMQTISAGYEGYKQLMILKAPIKTSLLVMLLIVTLLIVFCAVWFAFYVAGGLTGPIGRLAEATRRVAEGELDFVLEKTSGDEMGTLVDSFNRMTSDLLASKRQLEEANSALRQGNLDAETRRRYMEIVLQSVAAGVISLDEHGRITTINRFAEELLRIDRRDFEGKEYQAVLRPEHRAVLDGFLGELSRSGKSSLERPLRLTVGDETFSLRVNVTRLEDENNQSLGVVLVFDNLTELEKAQRMAAWREVARRIAHEVKNPLTPIQLSAQRLRKRYLDRLEGDQEVFDVCTKTIINQVDELKKLVSEFSSFARMPAVHKAMGNIAEMANEAFVLYQEAHKDRLFRLRVEGPIPLFSFDVKQMKRVLVNLLNNAVAATSAAGVIEIVLACEEERNVVILEVRDNGAGVSDQDKLRLFEPYFSRKKTGTGLGLAIASTVVADHHGYIRVKDNEPHGARFIIELPLSNG